ncbi:MAG TPA: hypothetical protein VF137_07340 [Candidatus Dormibacteraeota bacterium]
MSSRRAPKSDAWTDFLQDAAYRVGGLVREFVPAEAQLHLLNAQRELLTALILIYEHQAEARRGKPEPRRAVGSRGGERAPRLRRIDID